MTNNASLFASKLRQWRASNGVGGRLTQEELAEILDVSVDAIGKYERSLSYIRGDLEHRLSEKLGWSQDEIKACRVDWSGRDQSSTTHYQVLNDALVDQHFKGSWELACETMIAMVDTQFAPLPDELAANVDVFLPLYVAFRDQWAAVMCDGKIVAKWAVLLLLPEDEQSFRQGTLIETGLSVDRIRRSVLPGTYFGYCPALVICPGHEAATPLLLSSFTRFLKDMAARDVLLHGIGAVSVSPNGAQICRDLDMVRLGSHCLNPDYGVWELPGDRIATSLFARREPALKRAYSEEFRD